MVLSATPLAFKGVAGRIKGLPEGNVPFSTTPIL